MSRNMEGGPRPEAAVEVSPRDALSFVGERQELAFEGIERATGWETAGADLRDAFTTVRHAHEGMGDKNLKVRAKAEAALARADAIFGRVREKLMDAIRAGKLHDPSAVVPWEGSNGRKYFNNLNDARSFGRPSETFSAMLRTANDNQAALERLFGEKGKSAFWGAFNERAESLQHQETARTREREDKEAARFIEAGMRRITLTGPGGEPIRGWIKLRRVEEEKVRPAKKKGEAPTRERVVQWVVAETGKLPTELIKKGDAFRVEIVNLKGGHSEPRITNIPPRLKRSEGALYELISVLHYREIESKPKPKMVVESDIEEEPVEKAA